MLLNGSYLKGTYHRGLVPNVSMTLSAILRCRLDRSTPSASTTPPKKTMLDSLMYREQTSDVLKMSINGKITIGKRLVTATGRADVSQ
jgi:hypothetical protein